LLGRATGCGRADWGPSGAMAAEGVPAATPTARSPLAPLHPVSCRSEPRAPSPETRTVLCYPTERTMAGKPWRCKDYLQALYRANRARGPFAHFLRALPRAICRPRRSHAHPRFIAFSRTMRAFSASSRPPPAAPGRGRSSRFPIPDHRLPVVWGFLQELFPRARMGFPPATAARAPFLPASAAVPAVSLHAPTLHAPRPSRPPNAWGFLRPWPFRSTPARLWRAPLSTLHSPLSTAVPPGRACQGIGPASPNGHLPWR
jgi:hypothetical protein